MKMTVESRASYHASYRSMAFKRCADVIWNSLNKYRWKVMLKKERVNQLVYGHGWRFFDCWGLQKKGQHFQTGEKKLQKKKKKKREPRSNRVITVSPFNISDRIITALQCTSWRHDIRLHHKISTKCAFVQTLLVHEYSISNSEKLSHQGI